MTPLKPSEKRLLTVFGIAAFILLNLFGFSWMKKRNLALDTQRIKLEARSAELLVMKGQAPEAQQKRTFLDQHLQAYPDEVTREIYLDKFIQNEATSLSLELRKNQPKPVKLEPLFHKSVYTAEVSGAWDDILEFIYRLQAPKDFRFVSSLRLKSQKKEGGSDEASDVVCTFEIEKWWSPESALPPDPFDPNTPPETLETPEPPAEPAKTAATEQIPAPPVQNP